MLSTMWRSAASWFVVERIDVPDQALVDAFLPTSAFPGGAVVRLGGS
jgi:hypothetical protein